MQPNNYYCLKFCIFFKNKFCRKLRVMATNELRLRFQRTKIYKKRLLNVIKQKKSSILLDSVTYDRSPAKYVRIEIRDP